MEFDGSACVFGQTPSPIRVLPLIQEGELFIAQQIKKYYCPLNMIIFSQLLENEELREFLFWTSPLYEFNVSSGGGSAASISISLRSSSGLLKNVCILR